MENHYRSFDEMPVMLSVEDLMPILGVGRNTAYGLVRTGQIPSVRVGKQFRIYKEEVKKFVGANA